MKLKQKCINGIYISNDISNILCLIYANDIANCVDTIVNLQNAAKVHKGYIGSVMS